MFVSEFGYLQKRKPLIRFTRHFVSVQHLPPEGKAHLCRFATPPHRGDHPERKALTTTDNGYRISVYITPKRGHAFPIIPNS